MTLAPDGLEADDQPENADDVDVEVIQANPSAPRV